MKYAPIIILVVLSACNPIDPDLQLHLQAERDFHESIYNLDDYDPEYIDDCLYYEDLVCDFEK